MSGPSPSPEIDDGDGPLGLAHVAAASFVGARVAPSAQFWLTLPGGVAVARASAIHGLRRGCAVSLAATLQGVAILGPLRINGPLTQAISAPFLGRLRRRGAQLAACLALRLVHYAVLTALAIWLVLGGIDGFVHSYERVTGWLGVLPQGRTGALIVAFGYQFCWAVGFTVIQVAVYRRALRSWPEAPAGRPEPVTAAAPSDRDPRPLALAALIAFVLLVASTEPAVLIGVAAWLAVAWLLARPDRQTARVGLALAALLGLSALGGGLLGGLGAAEATRRAVRAALLVLVATWLRGAAGPEGMRTVFGGVLRRLRARESAALLDRLDSGARLSAAGRALLEDLRGVPRRPGPIADATTHWVAAEAVRGAAGELRARPRMIVRPRDRALVVLSALPLVGLLGHALT